MPVVGQREVELLELAAQRLPQPEQRDGLRPALPVLRPELLTTNRNVFLMGENHRFGVFFWSHKIVWDVTRSVLGVTASYLAQIELTDR